MGYLSAWNDYHRKLKDKFVIDRIGYLPVWNNNHRKQDQCRLNVYWGGIYLLEMTTTGNLIAIIEYLVKVNHLLEMTTNENRQIDLTQKCIGIYLFEMTTTEKKLLYSVSGIYLLEMTTTENWIDRSWGTAQGIYLLEMTTIENYHIILISDDC